MSGYSHPPITEAVIEVRVTNAVSQATLEKVASRFRRDYPQREEVAQIEVQLTPVAPPQAHSHPHGFKLSSEDGANLVLLNPHSITTSRLAPYAGWEELISRARANWDVWKKVVGYKEIARIGLRFINRIDIPMNPANGMVRPEDYLNISINLPNADTVFAHYAMQVVLPLRDGMSLVANSATVPSPLVDHGSWLLDLDYSKETNLPQRDDDLWQLINEGRQIKNDTFEQFITDKTRALFS